MFMKNILTLVLCVSITCLIQAQQFTRTTLPTVLDNPFEMLFGPDGYLWITEDSGVVSRVEPTTGQKTIVYKAPDYFPGSEKETNPLCFMPGIGHGTLGMDLHPDFMNHANAFIYYIYSYNNGTDSVPQTLWKLARLTWDWETETVTAKDDLVTGISNGYDHWGGRLKVLRRDDGLPMIYFSIGDHGISERNDPDCYLNQSENPNNFAQNPAYDNGKIHRYNIDGSIPGDNPIEGNSFYTRGHRNPQGLMYIPQHDLLFSIEHGDRTDDEVNMLEKGLNYGWKWVRGYHADNNYPGEAEFISTYQPHPDIEGDRLVQAFYSFCAEAQPDSDEFLEWCTPAPSDGIYYNSDAIPEWKNSFLITSLKNGTFTDNEIHVLHLNEDGRGLRPSTPENPNPETFFAEDQLVNGRLRDIAVSSDGMNIYLINNGGEGIPDKITTYTYQAVVATEDVKEADASIQFFPNPATDVIMIETNETITSFEIYGTSGEKLKHVNPTINAIDVRDLADGMYFVKIRTSDGRYFTRKFVRQ